MQKLVKTHNVKWPGKSWNPFQENLVYDGGSNSIDFPLRVSQSETIRIEGDWMSEDFHVNWQSLALATMALATNHVFITITKEWERLFSMLSQINDIDARAAPVPADITYVRAIERVKRNAGKFNLTRKLNIPADPARAKKPAVSAKENLTYAQVPWLPRNIFFGVEVRNIFEAEEAVFVFHTARRLFPEGRFMIYQATDDFIDWYKLGLSRGAIDWLICLGVPLNFDSLYDFGDRTGTPIYIDEAINDRPLESTMQQTPDITGVLV